jgi:tetraprenyl-beta-curcumene synthase
MTSALDGIAVVSALVTYKREIVPPVRSHLRCYEEAAEAIPDPVLRRVAVEALRQKSRNAEATAVFAILTPREQRAGVLRAITALQTAIDYLDSLVERPVEDPLAGGLLLHRALDEAVSPGAAHSDWYRLYPQSDDGGYLATLVATCQQEVAALPGSVAVLPAAQRAARRCGEGQSYMHAAAADDDDDSGLKDWAAQMENPASYSWWEVAAGAGSSVAIHALIAAAADARADAREAELIDAAYFPPIGALTVLLDDLIDLEEDRVSGEHNYLAYYPSSAVAADRLAFILSRAEAAIAGLRRERRHTAILAGIAGFYLSDPAAKSRYARPIRARLLESLGIAVYPVLAAMRVLRRG